MPNSLSMALDSGPVGLSVLLILVLCSLLSWAIIFAKWRGFKEAREASDKFLDLFWNAKSLDSIFAETKSFEASPVSHVFRAGYQEFQKLSAKSQGIRQEAGLSPSEYLGSGIENVQRALVKSSRAEALKLEKLLPLLATVASIAPYIGLFGTVVGIIEAFQSLGLAGSATLQKVAPGISKALVATAIGLGAAIPSVVGYNHFITKLKGFKGDMDSFAADFTNILKRNYPG